MLATISSDARLIVTGSTRTSTRLARLLDDHCGLHAPQTVFAPAQVPVQAAEATMEQVPSAAQQAPVGGGAHAFGPHVVPAPCQVPAQLNCVVSVHEPLWQHAPEGAVPDATANASLAL